MSLLASEQDGIDCDLLSHFAYSNERLKACFRIAFAVQADPFWGDFNIDWTERPGTKDNIALFNTPWNVTQELWERGDGLIQTGFWQITHGNRFEWLSYKRIASIYRLGGSTRVSLPPWGEVLAGARRHFLSWRKDYRLYRPSRLLASQRGENDLCDRYCALEEVWHNPGGDLETRETAYTESMAILRQLVQ